VLGITPEVTPLFGVCPHGKSSHASRSTTTATRLSGSQCINRRPHRGSLITFSIATDNRSRPACKRLQAIRARIEYRARTGRGFTANELLLTGLSPPILVRGLKAHGLET